MSDQPKTERQRAEERRYLNSLNSVQRSRYQARQSHQFADSIGGCSSNYRF